MLRSNLIGTLVAATALSGGVESAPSVWIDLDPPAVELIEPGSEPRQPLRYVISPGSGQTVRRAQNYEVIARLPFGASREDAGQVTLDIATRDVPPSGEADLEVRAELRSILGPNGTGGGVKGSGLVRFDDRGRALQAKWEQLVTDASMDSVLLQRFQTRVIEMSTPLPEEPIGVGGRWAIRQSLEQGGGRLVIVAECTFIAETDAGLDLECRFRHETDGSTFTTGSGKKAREVKLEESQVDGKSLVLQSLQALAPLREDGDLRTYFEAKTKMGLFPVKLKVDTAERWNQVGVDRL